LETGSMISRPRASEWSHFAGRPTGNFGKAGFSTKPFFGLC